MTRKYRHVDHKIEYVRAEWESEVLNHLEKAGYEIKEHNLVEGQVQPSFIVTAELKEMNKVSEEVKNSKDKELSNLYQDVWMPNNQLLIPKKEVMYGFRHTDFIASNGNCFFLSPTISPVEFSENYPSHLEHLHTAFEYFEKRGIKKGFFLKKILRFTSPIDPQ